MWTDERVELLKKLWAEGLSASQVAKQLGGVTRNAVIGKVHRLGLSGRATPSRPARARPQAPRTLVRGRPDPLTAETREEEQQRSQSAQKAEAAHVEERGLEPVQRATVLTLTEHTCELCSTNHANTLRTTLHETLEHALLSRHCNGLHSWIGKQLHE